MEATKDSHFDAIEAVRRFSRFYTRRLDLLDKGLLKSEFSLTEARVLYELAHRDELTSTELQRALGLDAGYLSRILKKFQARGLLTRETSPVDARRNLLTLAPAGSEAYEPLNQASQKQVTAMLAGLAPDEVRELVRCMDSIERLLGERAPSPVPYVLRPHHVGDLGWIVHRHGVLYAQEYGWDETFEAFVADVAANFIKNFDPKRENCWVAEREGHVVGAACLVRQSDAVAKLRLLYVEPEARALGIGRRLTDECIRFARLKGYTKLALWTNDVLLAAIHIYQSAGFKLIAQEPHHSFGKDLVGQHWELDL